MRSLRRLTTTLLPALGVAALAVAELHGQQPRQPAAEPADEGVVLAGVVRDTLGRPLAGAEVRVGRDHFDITELDGTFRIPGVTMDTVQLVVRRIGYHAADVVLAVDPRLRQVDLAVTMVPHVVELGTIVVQGRAMNRHLWRAGFYDRQRLGRGYLFGPEKLQGYGGSLATLVREVPSVQVQRGRFGGSFAYGRNGSARCRMAVFLDGIHLRWADEVGLEHVIAKRDILAIEVYPRAAEMPFTLRGAGNTQAWGGLPSPGPTVNLGGISAGACGSIVIWSKPLDES